MFIRALIAIYHHWLGPRVARLINPGLAAARQGQPREQSPTQVFHRSACNLMIFHRGDERLDVGTHEVELLLIIFLGWMYGDLCRR